MVTDFGNSVFQFFLCGSYCARGKSSLLHSAQNTKIVACQPLPFAPSLCLIKYDDITLLLRSLSNPQTPSKMAAACLPQLCPSSLADNMALSRLEASARNMGFCSLPTFKLVCFCTYALATRHDRKSAVFYPTSFL